MLRKRVPVYLVTANAQGGRVCSCRACLDRDLLAIQRRPLRRRQRVTLASALDWLRRRVKGA